MLDLQVWGTALCVASVLFLRIEYRQYKISRADKAERESFWRSKYFFEWLKEILLILLGYAVAYTLSTTSAETRDRENKIKILSAYQIDIFSEYKNNDKLINNKERIPESKSNVRNGEDIFIADLLRGTEAFDFSEDIRQYLNDEGQKIRSNYNAMQDEDDASNLQAILSQINSSYDNIMQLLNLEIEYYRKNITEFNVREQYEEYLKSKEMEESIDYGYRVELRVRIDGAEDQTWRNNINAQVGDVVEFRAQYKNVSDSVQSNVMIKNVPPKNLKIIPGSTVLYNARYPEGKAVESDAVSSQPFEIGSYSPGANALVDFKAEVIDRSLQSGSNTLVNWTQCGIGNITIQDYACITIQLE